MGPGNGSSIHEGGTQCGKSETWKGRSDLWYQNLEDYHLAVYYSSESGGTPKGLQEPPPSETWRCGVLNQEISEEERCL